MIRKLAAVTAAIAVLFGLTACATSREEAVKQFACTYEATLDRETPVNDVVTMLILAHGSFMDDGAGNDTRRFFTEQVMTLNNNIGLTLPAGKVIVPKRCDDPAPEKG